MIENGHTNRREATRSTILDACRMFMTQGGFSPTMHAVAHAAGRSVRTVFQHFTEAENLWPEALQDETVRRAVLLHITNSDVSCLDWPLDLQAAVIHAAVYNRPVTP